MKNPIVLISTSEEFKRFQEIAPKLGLNVAEVRSEGGEDIYISTLKKLIESKPIEQQ